MLGFCKKLLCVEKEKTSSILQASLFVGVQLAPMIGKALC